eukprot:1159652-Pelagomonas_calceolata.AAC.12
MVLVLDLHLFRGPNSLAMSKLCEEECSYGVEPSYSSVLAALVGACRCGTSVLIGACRPSPRMTGRRPRTQSQSHTP